MAISLATDVPELVASELAASTRGELIRPDDAGYDAARKVYNGMIDRRPGADRPLRDVADVIAAVGFAREQGLALAVRGGGHNAGGLGVCDGGLVIDLVAMRGVRVDPAERTVRVEGGCTLGDVDHATHPFGLAVPSGIISTTGVGGLTLGGGIGYLTRALRPRDRQPARRPTWCSPTAGSSPPAQTENPDLFWALRGGGGNFGVVTSFLFRAAPGRSTSTAGPMLCDDRRRPPRCCAGTATSCRRRPTRSTASSPS